MHSFLRSILLVVLTALISAPANAAVVVDVNSNCDVAADDDSEGSTTEGEEEPECD